MEATRSRSKRRSRDFSTENKVKSQLRSRIINQLDSEFKKLAVTTTFLYFFFGCPCMKLVEQDYFYEYNFWAKILYCSRNELKISVENSQESEFEVVPRTRQNANILKAVNKKIMDANKITRIQNCLTYEEAGPNFKIFTEEEMTKKLKEQMSAEIWNRPDIQGWANSEEGKLLFLKKLLQTVDMSAQFKLLYELLNNYMVFLVEKSMEFHNWKDLAPHRFIHAVIRRWSRFEVSSREFIIFCKRSSDDAKRTTGKGFIMSSAIDWMIGFGEAAQRLRYRNVLTPIYDLKDKLENMERILRNASNVNEAWAAVKPMEEAIRTFYQQIESLGLNL